MILKELKAYIAKKGTVSRYELAKEFALSEDGVDAMLEVWVKRGELSRMVDLDKKQNIRQVRYKVISGDDIQLTVIS